MHGALKTLTRAPGADQPVIVIVIEICRGKRTMSFRYVRWKSASVVGAC